MDVVVDKPRQNIPPAARDFRPVNRQGRTHRCDTPILDRDVGLLAAKGTDLSQNEVNNRLHRKPVRFA
jgi:hypothetical protein